MGSLGHQQPIQRRHRVLKQCQAFQLYMFIYGCYDMLRLNIDEAFIMEEDGSHQLNVLQR